MEFAGPVPGYDVRYVDKPVTEDPSNRTIAVLGDRVLRIRLDPASGVDLTSSTAQPSYEGSNRLAGPGQVIVEAVRLGDFESILQWGLGIKTGTHAFGVSTLTKPSRLVVDVAVTK